ARVFSSSGEPGGRTPNSTCLRTYSNALSPSKSVFRVFAGSGVAEFTSVLLPFPGHPKRTNNKRNANECDVSFSSLVLDFIRIVWRRSSPGSTCGDCFGLLLRFTRVCFLTPAIRADAYHAQ